MTPTAASEPSATRLDVADEAALADWAARLDATPEQLKAAVERVGPLLADVELDLKGSRSTSNAERTDASEGG